MSSPRIPLDAVPVERPTDVIFWLRPVDVARVLELPVPTSPHTAALTPRALVTRHGLLVHTHLGDRTLVRGPSSRGARCFFRANGAESCWVECRHPPPRGSAPSSRGSPSKTPRAGRDARITLLTSDASLPWSAPPPAAWPTLRDVLRWKCGPHADTVPTTHSELAEPLLIRLLPTPPLEHVAGCLARRGEHPDFGRRLGALAPRQRRGLQLFATPSHWCMLCARGLDEQCPRAGRWLRDLGTPIEPVLIPVDRTPAPGFQGAEIRRCHGVEDGRGLLWWDDDDGEHSVRIERSDLLTPTDELLRGWRW